MVLEMAPSAERSNSAFLMFRGHCFSIFKSDNGLAIRCEEPVVWKGPSPRCQRRGLDRRSLRQTQAGHGALTRLTPQLQPFSTSAHQGTPAGPLPRNRRSESLRRLPSARMVLGQLVNLVLKSAVYGKFLTVPSMRYLSIEELRRQPPAVDVRPSVSVVIDHRAHGTAELVVGPVHLLHSAHRLSKHIGGQ